MSKEVLISYKMRGESIDSIISNESYSSEKDIYKELETFETKEIDEKDLERIIQLSGDNSFFYTRAQNIDVSCASLNYVIESSSTEEEFRESFTKLSLMEDETRIKLIVVPDNLDDKYSRLASIEGIKLLPKSYLQDNKWIW